MKTPYPVSRLQPVGGPPGSDYVKDRAVATGAGDTKKGS